ncbi:MAG: SPASM domain-containing protein [Deltaproteobacteria bacterium]|nr:MAG: SPASM domain-containing protein [Deltaproteobacteria bacterium]
MLWEKLSELQERVRVITVNILVRPFTIVNRSVSVLRTDGIAGYVRFIRKKIYTKWLRYPSSLLIEVSSKCNLNCSICQAVKASKYRKNSLLLFDDYKKIIDDVSFFCFQINLSFCGEPLLNKDIERMIVYAANKKIDVVISTNGELLSPECAQAILKTPLSRIIISLDAVNETTYKKIRGSGNYDAIVNNIGNLINKRKKLHLKSPVVELQMVCTKANEGQIDEFVLLADQMGADVASIKTLYIDPHGGESYKKNLIENFLPKEGISRYDVDDYKNIKLKEGGPCPSLNMAVITCDGDVVMCCFDIYGKFNFGNAIRESFKEIWKDGKYKSFRENVMKNRKLDLCKTCIYSDCPSIKVELNTNHGRQVGKSEIR